MRRTLARAAATTAVALTLAAALGASCPGCRQRGLDHRGQAHRRPRPAGARVRACGRQGRPRGRVRDRPGQGGVGDGHPGRQRQRDPAYDDPGHRHQQVDEGQEKFAAAQVAATTFLDTVPDDVYVGITTFDSDVESALVPTLDREAARQVLAGLQLNRQTRLYEGVVSAVKQAGNDGQRTVLVLSDGADTSTTKLDAVTQAITDNEVLIDVVSLDQVAKHLAPLQAMADAGTAGSSTSDPATLKQAFTDAADALARQVLVTVDVPASVSAAEGTVAVSLPAVARSPPRPSPC
ncbi:MAG: vWA domain-containing protein [Nocardioides sp.]